MSDVKGLVRAIARMTYSDGVIDGGDLQELLVKHGCITLETVDAPCSGGCLCADYSDFPVKCYRLTPEFAEDGK